MSTAAIVYAVIFGGLVAVTAATHLRRWRWATWLKNHDACAYLPTWTFFAPNPGVTDTRVLWREQLADGTVSHWHELVPPCGGLARAVWNPTKRARKGVTDCAPMIVRLVARNKTSVLPMLSLPYLMLVQHVAGLPGSPLSVARQFTVINTQGSDEGDGLFRLLFVSHWHRQTGVGPETRLRAPDRPELSAEEPQRASSHKVA
jgi:hypothetical protein